MSPDRYALNKQTRLTLIGVGIIAISLIASYLIWFSWINEVPASRENASTWGTFGDFIGGVLNPLVAFCALYWLTRSIEIQREELADTKLALQDQSKTAEKQRFEDTFFSLLEQHNAVLKSLTEMNGVITQQEPDSKIISNDIFFNSAISSLQVANMALKRHDGLCGHYFRVLYQLLKLIATRCPGATLGDEFNAQNILASAPSPEEKMYSNIVRAFLNIEITQLLAVNCYCANDANSYWNYKCLVERYEFLEHMPFKISGKELSILVQTKAHYLRRAFGNSEFFS